MHGILGTPIVFFALVSYITSAVVALNLPILPVLPCNLTRDFFGLRSQRGCAADVTNLVHPQNLTRSPGISVPGGGRDFRPAEFRIFRSTQRLLYENYGPEMPNFDDVADMIDNAIDEVRGEMKGPQGGSAYIQKVRGWNLGTAHLSIANPSKYDGLDHRQLLQYLRGLYTSGTVYGFFEVKITFWDDALTIHERGTAVLERSSGPR